MIGGVYDLDLAVTDVENYVASGENVIDWSNTLVIVTYASGGQTTEPVTVSARGAGATWQVSACWRG